MRYRIFFIILILLVVLEICFRVYDYRFKYKHIISGEKTDIPFEEIQTFLFKSGYCVLDKNLIWRYTKKFNTKNGIYHFNSLGLRTNGEKEPSQIKGNNTYRVIVFGGSQPFGMGVYYEETYSFQLEMLFKKEGYRWKKNIEVINASVPGYSTIQVLNLLKYHMVKFEPDLVIIDAGNNDGISLKSSWPWRDSEIIRSMNNFLCEILNVLDRSSLFWYSRLLLNKIVHLVNLRKNKLIDQYSTRVSQKENLENLEEIKKISQSDNFKVIFLSQMLMREGRLCRGNGAAVKPYLDIYLQFKEKNDISKYFIDDIHCSANGHKEIAQIIYNYLLSSSWFLTGL